MQRFAVDEVLRIQDHLLGAEALAAMRSLEGLDVAQRLTRSLLLDELARYREAGVFPKNRDFRRDHRPYFIDADGTRCAMAHLMELGGAHDLVSEIARTNNNAYVPELANDARFVRWLRAAGLTVEEAARIQPSYCPTAAECMCIVAIRYNPESAGVVWEGTVLPRPDAGFHDVFYARVDAVHAGDPGDAGVGGERIIQAGVSLSAGERFLAHDITPIATVDAAGTLGMRCLASGDYAALPPFTRARAVSLAGSGFYECAKRLIAEDPAWAAATCSDRRPDRAVDSGPPSNLTDSGAGSADSPPSADSTGGCSAASASPESLSVLFAVLAALAVRRRLAPKAC